MLGKEAIFSVHHPLDAAARAAEGGNMTASDWFALDMLWRIDDIISQLESVKNCQKEE